MDSRLQLQEDLKARLARSNAARVDYLQKILTLGSPFGESARLEAGSDATAVMLLKEQIQLVIRTVERLKERVEANADLLEISSRVTQLQAELSSLGHEPQRRILAERRP